jgi:hypothetical protein
MGSFSCASPACWLAAADFPFLLGGRGCSSVAAAVAAGAVVGCCGSRAPDMPSCKYNKQ